METMDRNAQRTKVLTTLDLSIELWLEAYINHYKFWEDGKATTVLVDATNSVIAYFDRNTPYIDIIKLKSLYQWDCFYKLFWTYQTKTKWEKIPWRKKIDSLSFFSWKVFTSLLNS